MERVGLMGSLLNSTKAITVAVFFMAKVVIWSNTGKKPSFNRG